MTNTNINGYSLNRKRKHYTTCHIHKGTLSEHWVLHHLVPNVLPRESRQSLHRLRCQSCCWVLPVATDRSLLLDLQINDLNIFAIKAFIINKKTKIVLSRIILVTNSLLGCRNKDFCHLESIEQI